jgi:hypothetical protein
MDSNYRLEAGPLFSTRGPSELSNSTSVPWVRPGRGGGGGVDGSSVYANRQGTQINMLANNKGKNGYRVKL